MSELAQQKCSACHPGAPLATDDEVDRMMPQLPDWQIIELDQIRRLKKNYSFKNFKQALTFTNAVGDIAEAEGHHPLITTEWGKVSVMWWTHKIRGLHVNDFIMAAKTDSLYSG